MSQSRVFASAAGALCFAGFSVLFAADGARAEPYVVPGVGYTDPGNYYPAAPAPQADYGGGFIEMLMTGDDPTPRRMYGAPRAHVGAHADVQVAAYAPAPEVRREMDPMFQRAEVDYDGAEHPGAVIIDTAHKFLYLVTAPHHALRYGIGVGRPGFEWHGVKTISRKAEWPDWTPPAEMLARRPDLPHFMRGGPENPLGARAMYLGSSLYRIHGTNEPNTIGQNVSSGCIRMMNDDVVDLYSRVRVGTTVYVR
jgi:lipoprotein-anchoring transpeptidase ErfK/SrfK